MEYAIETVNLVKRYPTSARKGRNGSGGHYGVARVVSLSRFLSAFRGMRGPFIEALRGVNLKIRTGEIFGVLGPNGAGKTTIIKTLCTLVIHDEGEVYVDGFDVKKKPGEVLKHLQAVLPESRGFNWRLTGRQNLEFYALLYGLRKNETKDRIDYLLEFSGLGERSDDSYQRFSTGMQRKLLLCRALLRDTPTLVFDEPTAGLDPTSAMEFRTMLRNRLVREEKKTVLLSTHNLYEAQEICDRVAILDHGKITACDTPDNIRSMMVEEKVFSVAFMNTIFGKEQERMVDELEKIPGVHGATPEVDPDSNFHGMSIRLNRNMNLSTILDILMRTGLQIRTMSTNDPTLEDAFMAITAETAEQPDEPRSQEES